MMGKFNIILSVVTFVSLHSVAALLTEKTSVQRHPAADFDHLHSLYESCFDMLQDAENATVAHRNIPVPTSSNPIRFGQSWVPINGTPVHPNLENVTLDFEKPSPVLPIPRPENLLIFAHNHQGNVETVCFSKDGSLVASVSINPGPVRIVSYNNGGVKEVTKDIAREQSYSLPAVRAMDFHWKQPILFTGDQEGNLRAHLDLHSPFRRDVDGKLLLADSTMPISCLSVHPSSQFILLGTDWARHTASTAARRAFQASAAAANSQEAKAEGGSPLRLLDIETAREVVSSKVFVSTDRAQDHRGATTCMQWSSTGAFFATGGSDGVVALWDGQTVRRVNAMKLAHAGQKVTQLRILRNNHLLLSAGLDGTARIWDLRMGKELVQFHPCMQSSAFSHCSAVTLYDEKYVIVNTVAASLEGQRESRLYDATTGAKLPADLSFGPVYSMDASTVDPNNICFGSDRGSFHMLSFKFDQAQGTYQVNRPTHSYGNDYPGDHDDQRYDDEEDM